MSNKNNFNNNNFNNNFNKNLNNINNNINNTINNVKNTINNTVNSTYNSMKEFVPDQNYIYLLILILIMFILGFMFFISETYRISYPIDRMTIYTKYQKLQPIKKKQAQNKLADYYIASSYNSALPGYQTYDYLSERVVKKVLQSGARYLEFQVFNNEFTDDPIPVVSSGYHQGEWKLTLNTVPLETIFKTIRDNAWKMYDGTDGSPGYTDPLFLALDLKTNSHYVCNNKIAHLLKKYFIDYFLDTSFSYQRKNIGEEPLSTFLNKIVIIANGHFYGSELEELVNQSWAHDQMLRLHFDQISLDPRKRNQFDSLSYSDLKEETSNESKDRITQEKDDALKVQIDRNHLKKVSRNKMVIIVPQKEGDFYTNNYNPKEAWKLGAQFVAMNYAKIDNPMDNYVTRFRNLSFILKPQELRN